MTDAERLKIFNDMVCRYKEKLYWHIRSIVVSHDDADDILQDVFLKVWQSLPSFRRESGEFTWLWRISTNMSLNFLRRRSIRAALSFESLSAALEKQLEFDGISDGDKAQGALCHAIAKLPPKQKAVFCMRYYEELPYEVISEITGTSVGALKANYHMAKEKISAEVGGLH